MRYGDVANRVEASELLTDIHSQPGMSHTQAYSAQAARVTEWTVSP